jgi:hypothetical protein
MSAFNGNYSGGTFLSNLVTRPEFLQYTSEGIFEQSKWVQSGIVQRNAALDARAGGTRVRVPFFDPIAPTESQILSNSTWGGGGGYLVPANVTADEQIMTLLHRGFAYAADDLSQLGSGADPLAHVRNQLTAAINKLKTATLAAQLLGLFGPIAGSGVLGPNQLDKTIADVPGNMVEANFLNVANVVGTKVKLGERGDELDSIAMHSNVAYYLQQVGMLVFSTSALSTGGAITWGGGGVGVTQTEVPFFAGLRVVIDDQLTALTGGTATHAKKYPVYLFKSGVVAEGIQQDLRLAADRNILSMQDVLAVDYHYGYHVTGTKWAASTDNPLNTTASDQLGNTASWNLVYSTTKMVPVARLLVNTPFDTTAYA